MIVYNRIIEVEQGYEKTPVQPWRVASGPNRIQAVRLNAVVTNAFYSAAAKTQKGCFMVATTECTHIARKRHGFTRTGEQRFRCKDCGVAFTAKTEVLEGMRIDLDRAETPNS